METVLTIIGVIFLAAAVDFALKRVKPLLQSKESKRREAERLAAKAGATITFPDD